MIDLKFTALMDFLAWVRGQYPEKTESGGAEEFVPYEDVRQASSEKVEESDAHEATTVHVGGQSLDSRDGHRE